MRINVTSVMVEDQQKALAFYTNILGFVKNVDVPLGADRWLTVVSPDAPDGTELLLEPNNNPAVPAREWQKALYNAGIPATSFAVDDVTAEYQRLTGLGVHFVTQPATHDGVTTAIFDDTCGNLIVIVAA